MNQKDRRAALKELLEELSRELLPSREQTAKVAEARDLLMQRSREVLKGLPDNEGLSIEPLIVGSVAKETFLWPCDLDLFLLFEPGIPFERVEQTALELGRRLIEEPQLLYASHPYTRGRFQGFEVDVVPCYRVQPGQRIESAVDRTPLHTAFVNQQSDERLRIDMRLFKAFCKGLGIYGAEASIGGLSGYLCELLVMAHEGLAGLLEALVEWRPPVHLIWDGEGSRWRTSQALNSKARGQPGLSLDDPTDARRNVAAALGGSSLALLILGAKELLARPRRALFHPPTIPALEPAAMAGLTGQRRTWLALVEMAAPQGLAEVVNPQLLSLRRQLWQRLEMAGFGPLGLRFRLAGGRWMMGLELERALLPATRLHKGPHGWRTDSENFLLRWASDTTSLGRVHVLGERLVVQHQREATDLAAYLSRTLPGLRAGEPTRTSLNHAPRVTVWAPGQPPLTGQASLLSQVLDPGLPWQGRYAEPAMS